MYGYTWGFLTWCGCVGAGTSAEEWPGVRTRAIYGQLKKEHYGIAILADVVQRVSGGADGCACVLRQHPASPWSMCPGRAGGGKRRGRRVGWL